MIATPTQFAELQKGQIDALFALSHTMFDATERYVDLNLAATKALMEESAEQAQVLLGVKDVQEWMSVGSGLAQPTLEKWMSYGRNVYSIATEASNDVSKIIETQVADGNKKFVELIDVAAKSAPAGSEPAVSMFKNVFAAANTAYDTWTKAAKQAVEVAESNLNAATAATVKAANDVVKPVKAKKAA